MGFDAFGFLTWVLSDFKYTTALCVLLVVLAIIAYKLYKPYMAVKEQEEDKE